jgi:amino acid adenylation domain-containing protein
MTQGCLHQMFERQAASTPDRVALSYGADTMTYRELNDHADRLAAGLRAAGVAAETIVGVCAGRSAQTIVALIAIMKAGGAYAPLDPGLPSERLAYMVADLRCPLVLAQRDQRERLELIAPGRVRGLDGDGLPPGDSPAIDPPAPAPVTASNLAVVVYTSGSTGLPKAVLSPHGGFVNFVRWITSELSITGEDVICQLSAHGYDAWVWELFAPLSTGGRVVIAPQSAPLDVDLLAHLIEGERVTITHFVPPVLHLLADLRPRFAGRLRWICCSGEVLPVPLIERLRTVSPARLANLFGATEASVDQTYHLCEPGDSGDSAPAGRPIANTSVSVRDAAWAPVPTGREGEICIGGAGVTRGYHGRPRLTAERFVPDPDGNGERMYLTGDVGRLEADGHLEFLGRRDGQVKVAGVRIELGEVEAALAADPAVAYACAAVSQDGQSIEAFVVGRGGTPGAAADLRARLAARLPRHLVPSRVRWLPRLPLTPSGKVDRAALRSYDERYPSAAGPGDDAQGDGALVDPVLATVIGIWRRCLQREEISGDDNFFAVGGSSLAAARILAETRDAFGLPLDVSAVYGAATAAEMAQVVREARALLAELTTPAAQEASR